MPYSPARTRDLGYSVVCKSRVCYQLLYNGKLRRTRVSYPPTPSKNKKNDTSLGKGESASIAHFMDADGKTLSMVRL